MKLFPKRLWQTAVGLSASWVLMSANCSTGSVEALVAGVEAATQTLDQLDRDRPDDDMTFGEWLLQELND